MPEICRFFWKSQKPFRKIFYQHTDFWFCLNDYNLIWNHMKAGLQIRLFIRQTFQQFCRKRNLKKMQRSFRRRIFNFYRCTRIDQYDFFRCTKICFLPASACTFSGSNKKHCIICSRRKFLTFWLCIFVFLCNIFFHDHLVKIYENHCKSLLKLFKINSISIFDSFQARIGYISYSDKDIMNIVNKRKQKATR